MSFPALPAALTPALSDREAVADALYRCVVSLDTANPTLFKSAFTNDSKFELNGIVMDGLDAIHAQCYAFISTLDTTHILSNLRVHILEGGSKAELTCSAMAQHFAAGEGMKPGAVPLLAGSTYWVELVKDAGDGLWKIQRWVLQANWGQGDWGVLAQKK